MDLQPGNFSKSEVCVEYSEMQVNYTNQNKLVVK